MIFLYILIAIILLFILILFTNIKIKIEYRDKLNFDLYFGIFKIPLKLFSKEKKSKEKVKNPKKSEKKKKNSLKEKIKKNGYVQTLSDTAELAKSCLSTLGKFISKITINPFELKLVMVGKDAAKLAIEYGQLCAIYYPLISTLNRTANCKKINSNICVDYTKAETEIYFKTQIKFRLISVLTSAVKIIKEFLDFKSKLDDERN